MDESRLFCVYWKRLQVTANTGWLLKNAFCMVQELYLNSDGMHDVLIWGNTMHFSLSMDALFDNPYDLL
jgi:hypothetical protein